MPTAAAFSTIEVLHDGQRVEIRALRPEDQEEMLAAIRRTSAILIPPFLHRTPPL